MAGRKLNVLVYSGGGTTSESVRHCLDSLRQLLSPNYAVLPLSEAALLGEPWPPTCALLVVPGGADLGYCRVLNGRGNRLITDFVRRGGAYLGFCAGGYYGSARCEFEVGSGLEVVGPRELSFFPGTCRGGAFRGFEYRSEKGARAAELVVCRDAFSGAGSVPAELVSYYNGGGVFVDAQRLGIQILAEYRGDLDVEPGDAKAAVVFCQVGNGSALLTGPHPEFAEANLHKQPDVPGYDELRETLRAGDEARTNFLRACLTKLGLEVSQESQPVPSLSKLHLSSLQPERTGKLLRSLDDIISREDGSELIECENDTFCIERPGGLSDGLPSDQTVRVAVHESWPEPRDTPYFDHAVYYASLRERRGGTGWGDSLLYGEVVTSTNTLLERNPKLLSHLPTGFTLAATTQIAGRGRGSNVWVSPAGSLIMSTVINHPARLAASRPIVFVQYLAAVAVVEAVQAYGSGCEALPVRLKWPNDIYVGEQKSRGHAPLVKIGGILSNCSFCDGNYQIVLGIGLNANNERPTTSLDALLSGSASSFRIERLVAGILARLEALYADFCRDGFAGRLERAYYRHWLHSGQTITLEAEGGVPARVVGISADWGMLRAEELRADGINGALRPTGRVWSLQSDENSFDFWRGLVRRR